jgi:hypothetical protein
MRWGFRAPAGALFQPITLPKIPLYTRSFATAVCPTLPAAPDDNEAPPPSLVAAEPPRPTPARGRPAAPDAKAPPPVKHNPGPGPEGLTEEDISRNYVTAYQRDPAPTASSAKREAAIVAGFSSPRAEGAHLNGVDCRATRCRLDIDFTDQEAGKRVLLDLFGILSSSGVEDSSSLGFYVTSRNELPGGKVQAEVHLFPVEHGPAR